MPRLSRGPRCGIAPRAASGTDGDGAREPGDIGRGCEAGGMVREAREGVEGLVVSVVRLGRMGRMRVFDIGV